TLSVLPFTEISAELGFTAVTPVPLAGGVAVFDELGLVDVPLPEGEVVPEPDVPQPPLEPVSPAHLMLICCVNGSLLRKRLKASSWPDCGAGRTPGSFTPSPPAVEPAAAVAASAPLAPGVPVEAPPAGSTVGAVPIP